MALSGGRTINVGQLLARIVFRSDNRGLQQAERGLGRIRRGITSLTPQLLAVTGAIAGIGIAGTRAFLPFEEAITRLISQVGLSQDEVDRLSLRFRDLAGEYGVQATDIANAYFKIASAGFRGERANQALIETLEATVIGYGTATEVASTLIPALQVYAREGLTAANVTDVLAASVREGNLEASGLARALPIVLSQAENLGIGLDELGASFAQISQSGLTASRSAEQLRALLTALQNPSAQAQDILNRLGLTVSDLGDRVANDFFETVVALRFEYGLTNQELTQLVGSTEAFGAIVNLTAGDLDVVRRRFDAVANSAGDANAAFGAASQTAGQELRRALATVNALFIDLGEASAPVLVELVEFVRPLVESIRDWIRANPELAARIAIVAGIVAATTVAIIALGAAIAAISAVASVGWPVLAFLAGAAAAAAAVIWWDELAAAIANVWNWLARVGQPLAAAGGFLSRLFGFGGDDTPQPTSALSSLSGADPAQVRTGGSRLGAGSIAGAGAGAVVNNRMDGDININIDGTGRNAGAVADEVEERLRRETAALFAASESRDLT